MMQHLQKIWMTIWYLRQRLIYTHAMESLWEDVSPKDLAPDSLGCAESVTNILNKVTPTPIIIGTWTLNEYFENSPKWARKTDHQPGDVIISPTGTGNGLIRGHVGIIGEDNVIMSNDSSTGQWRANYTISKWVERYQGSGGFPVYYYRLIR